MRSVDILLLGDVILDVPEPDYWIGGVADVTRAADLAIAHLEVPHTRRGVEMAGDVPAPGADPDHLAALARAGIGMVSMAGNHIADCGADGILDTNTELDRLGIAHSGAGLTLSAARTPAVIERGGRRIVLISANCVGPEESWATDQRAGCDYVVVRPADGGAVRPQSDLVTPDPLSVAELQDRVADAKRSADVVVVALHKGVTHRPAVLAPYERPLSQAAIEAGADAIAGHHAHIARGIEVYQGRPIFHGLGNGVVVTNALGPGQDHPARAEWVERRKRMFGFEPDPAYPLAPFHPEAVNGMIGRVRLHTDGSIAAGFLPVWVAPPGRPQVAESRQAQSIADYIDGIGVRSGLPPLSRRHDAGWIDFLR